MKTVDILFGLLLILILFTVAHSWCGTPKTRSEKFTDDANKHRLVLYTAGWCPHCHALLKKDVWKKFNAALAKDSDLSTKLMTQHLTQEENKSTWASYGIEGVPAIVLYLKDGTGIQMPYPIDDDVKMMAFVKKNV